jgi:outer membrane protein TolC
MIKKYLISLYVCITIAHPLNTYAQDSAADPKENLAEEPAEKTAPEVSKEDPVELTDGPQTLEAPAAVDGPVRKANGPILTEDEILKPLPKKIDSKIKADKINESEIYIQDIEKFRATATYKNLKLNDVIEQGLRKNYDQNMRDQQSQLNELTFIGVKRSFWVPELKLTLTTAEQRISTLRSSNNTPAVHGPTVPNGAFGLALGNYTVFNWGKDYSVYLNNKATYERNQKSLDENKREFRLDLILQYFTLMSLKNIEKITQEQLKQASFLYRLNKEKVAIGKTSKQDYYQARSEYLRSQSEYHTAKIATDLQDENMSYILTDEVGTKYLLNDTLTYKRLRISLDECFSLAEKNNPSILNSKTSLENADRSYDVALKENLPLPKFTVNLGAYMKRFGPNTNRTVYENSSTGGNMELVASINASWSLTGSDGLFNADKLSKSWMNKELIMKELEKNNHLSKSYIRQSYNNVLAYQNQILIQEARIPSLQKTFDTILENYLNNKTRYYDFHIILAELTQAKMLLEETMLLHLKEKLALAKFAGIEDFPGENFERMADFKQEKKGIRGK